jgi:hypothetical protein
MKRVDIDSRQIGIAANFKPLVVTRNGPRGLWSLLSDKGVSPIKSCRSSPHVCMSPKSFLPGLKANIFHDCKRVWNGTCVLREAFLFLKLKCQVSQEFKISRIRVGLKSDKHVGNQKRFAFLRTPKGSFLSKFNPVYTLTPCLGSWVIHLITSNGEKRNGKENITENFKLKYLSLSVFTFLYLITDNLYSCHTQESLRFVDKMDWIP